MRKLVCYKGVKFNLFKLYNLEDKTRGRAFLKGGVMLRPRNGSSSGGSLKPWHIYIDVSFLPPPSSAPQLDIQVHRQSNCTGLRSLHITVLKSRLTESP